MGANQSITPKLSESEERERLIKLLEERLEKHDENRKSVQEKLKGLQNELIEQVDKLEERITKELEDNFTPEDDRLQTALNELRGDGSASVIALQKAKTELRLIQSYEIIGNKEVKPDLTALYELKTNRRDVSEGDLVGLIVQGTNISAHDPSNATEKGETARDSDKLAEERDRLIGMLEERLENHYDNRKAAQDRLHEICGGLRAQVSELEERIAKELEDKFTSEDNRLQTALNELRGDSTSNAPQKAKAELLAFQSYEIIENKEPKRELTILYELKAERRIVPELVEMRKPTNVRVAGIKGGRVSVELACFNSDEERVLSDHTIANPVKYKCLLSKKGRRRSEKEYPLDKNEGDSSSLFTFTPDTFEAGTPHEIRAKMVVGNRESEWSDGVAEFTPEFNECCAWKKCPDDDAYNIRKYIVDEKNPRIASKINYYFVISFNCSTIIGNTTIPLNKVTSWNIKIHKIKNNGHGIYIGIAPSDINQNVYNCNKCGWYFYCCSSKLYSGPPHSYDGKVYGPRKENGQYVHTGDSVGVAVDTAKGDLSFVLNGVNLGAAYEGIPLDKPLVPCVILLYEGGSVEFII